MLLVNRVLGVVPSGFEEHNNVMDQ
jgi:hypothetical protein